MNINGGYNVEVLIELSRIEIEERQGDTRDEIQY